MWPESSDVQGNRRSKLGHIPYRMTEHIDFGTVLLRLSLQYRQIGSCCSCCETLASHLDGVSMRMRKPSSRASPVDGYQGVISLTTDGGKTFTPVFNITGQGLYFNEIFCIDINICWAAAEGIDPKSLGRTASFA